MKLKHLFFSYLLFNIFFSFSQEKKILNIEIIGAKKTKTSFIKSKIKTTKNAVLDSLKLDKDIIFLKRLPAISHAYFKVNKSHDNFYNVLINVEENFTLLPEVGIWTSTNNKFSYKLGLYDYNFLGKNMTLGGFYQNNGFDTYGLSFKASNLFSNKWGLSFNFQNWKSEEPLYFNNNSANYMYNNISYEAMALYQINLKNQLNFGVNFFNEKYKYISGAISAEIPQFLDIDKMLYKVIYKYNDLDYFYQYVDGFKNEFYGQFVTSNNSFQNDFLIFWNDLFYFKRIGAKGNLANKLRVGLASNNNTPFAPFSLDNNVNLRGVGILVDRGTGSIVLNTEYRYTLFDKKWFSIQGNAFIDSGSWRNPGGSINDFFQKENIRIFSGFGLRFINKKIYNATFRLDYGFKIHDQKRNSKGGFVFGIGQYF